MEIQGLRLRRARRRDIATVAAIEDASFPDPWKEEIFLEALECYGAAFFVAEYADRIVGFVTAALEDTGTEIYGHIMNIAVDHQFRSKGIGTKLVARIELECLIAGATAMQLEVRQSNRAAQEFYQRIGYQQALTIAGYYANGEDAVLMIKWFSIQ
jgi:ribosomal-protein-alanine N-acetyltransferase